jgi:hypothetical protein
VRLFCVCVLCVGSGLATVCSPSKESCLPCKKDYETEEEARAQQRAVGPLMIELMKLLYLIQSFIMHQSNPRLLCGGTES